MSIELRIDDVGNIDCHWGPIEHTEPRPESGDVGHLMIVLTSTVANLIKDGPTPNPAPRDDEVYSITHHGDRLFAHLDYHGQRWTWELFDAHFDDGEGPDVYIGRWPD